MSDPNISDSSKKMDSKDDRRKIRLIWIIGILVALLVGSLFLPVIKVTTTMTSAETGE